MIPSSNFNTGARNSSSKLHVQESVRNNTHYSRSGKRAATLESNNRKFYFKFKILLGYEASTTIEDAMIPPIL